MTTEDRSVVAEVGGASFWEETLISAPLASSFQGRQGPRGGEGAEPNRRDMKEPRRRFQEVVVVSGTDPPPPHHPPTRGLKGEPDRKWNREQRERPKRSKPQVGNSGLNAGGGGRGSVVDPSSLATSMLTGSNGRG